MKPQRITSGCTLSCCERNFSAVCKFVECFQLAVSLIIQFKSFYNEHIHDHVSFFFLEFATKTNGKWNCSLKKTISAGRAIVIKVNSTVTSGTEISSLLYDTKQLLQIGRVKDCWLKQTRKSITKVNKFISLKYS